MTVINSSYVAHDRQVNGTMTKPIPRTMYSQEPIAVVGLACRLPGNSNSPPALWEFLERGGVASNQPPETRFNFKGHSDGSTKPRTMRSPGGMFLESIDPRDIDAQFFGLSRVDAIAMDPQQRQLLEVVYEGLENAGISLQSLSGQKFGCFVGSYASDYTDIQSRDPEDRAPSVTIGIGRAMLSNRISHFLNIKGTSMTVDTACSGSLVGVDLACRYLQTREISGAIVAGCNLYLSPEHTMDLSAMGGAASRSGKCHTFDVKADGYVKSEAVNTAILKRLDDAIRDGDPVRAVIRGTATNSDGWTPGIASPSSEAQAAAIRQAYANAGISDLNSTGYLECHGTGTQAGDPIEVSGIASVFAATRPADRPLIVGSIKSNLGHSEPAAGISGMLKAILAIEKGIIPGNPTFITPNPKINFKALKVRVSRTTIPWPEAPFRRASVSSYGYGGTNAHIILDDASTVLEKSTKRHVSSFVTDKTDIFGDDDGHSRLSTLVFSANDEESLKEYCKAINRHLINPSVYIKLRDLAYTLSERRTHHFHRGYVVTENTTLQESAFVFGKMRTDAPRIGFVFTGQGAQWSQMGKGLVGTFPAATRLLKHLDEVLQGLPTPPSWSLLDELVEPRDPERLRLPEFSQPLVTALQLAILDILKDWGVKPQSVVGHSSGEIAAAAAAGHLTPEEAIKVAYYRGQAASDLQGKSTDTTNVGMLAVGLGSDAVQPYIEESKGQVQIGCFNSPSSVTLSGDLAALEEVRTRLQADKHFARLLLVNLAYHSKFMGDIAKHYEDLLLRDGDYRSHADGSVTMFSSVAGGRLDQACDSAYWRSNMVSPVRFEQAVQTMVSERDGADFLIEIGPSGALAGPISQIKKALTGQGASLEYVAAANRGADSVKALFDVAGRLFISGGTIDFSKVNKDEQDPEQPSVIIDLPNYVWNHSTKYWHESESSKDWRFRKFPHHDLLGSKILGTSWNAPSWKKILRIQDLPWLKDHRMGQDIVFPAAGYMAMAVEAIYQYSCSLGLLQGKNQVNKSSYRLRNVTFAKALVLQEGAEHKVMLSLSPQSGAKDSWLEFKISSLTDDVWNEHSRGLVCLKDNTTRAAAKSALKPLEHPTPARLWYKAMQDAGYSFGPLFQKQLEIESVAGSRSSRSTVSLSEPSSQFKQSPYPMHPACIDGCLQSAAASLWEGHRSSVNAVLIPAIVDEVIINSPSTRSETGLSVTSSEYIGVGRPEETKNYKSNVQVYDPSTGALLFQFSGLRYHKLDTREDLHAAHTYTRVAWKPDATFLSQEILHHLATQWTSNVTNGEDNYSWTELNQVIDTIGHKKPNLKVMEISATPSDSRSVWLDGGSFDRSSRAASRQFHLASATPNALMASQEKYGTQGNAEFSIVDITKAEDFVASEKDFDLVLVKLPTLTNSDLANVARNARSLLIDGGHLLLLEKSLSPSDSGSDSAVIVNGGADPSEILHASGFSTTLKIPDTQQSNGVFDSAYLSTIKSENSGLTRSDKRIELVHLSRDVETTASIKQSLAQLGWQISEHSFPFANLQPKSTVLVLDELFDPVLANVDEGQWQAVQRLIGEERTVLWVTTGSQLEVTRPHNALIHGLARTVRAEDPSVVLTTLDVESSSSAETPAAIDRVLKTSMLPRPKTQIENEFVERGGVIHVSRVLADDPINQAEREDTHGAELQLKSLHDHPTVVRMRAERLGTLESLHYGEVSAEELPLPDNFVEVEVFAAGLNFKDVAVTMGIVPENQHLLGLEGAGIVRRIGKQVHDYKVGQRVLVHKKGSFANRVSASVDGIHHIPDSMTFEEAATLACVYLMSIYGLFDIANTKKGQSVLIHSAAGGVGIAAIQLCKYIGAEIYATVGTQGKRNFLQKNFGIPSDHIFSSRSADFAAELMAMTKGRGVDVILNSLTGDLLDASWRCVADHGTMVEIGKKDILDRSNLSMEPFNRNASYRAVDMSHKSITDDITARLLSRLFDLIAKGHVKPISPIKIFPFDDIPGAFRFMRGGSHIGKIVISNGPESKVQVLVRPAPRQFSLRSDVSYLIVGGLKGLCGSLAVYMARHGATHLAVMSRSGHDDERSRGVLRNIHALGAHVDLIKGDVSSLEDVKRAFRESTKPIGGVVQGAMVLRDKIFTSMTVREFHEVISSKVQGTWNLHTAALEANLTLDFFTLLSSISGVVGQKGQANYAAANVFLDAFSLHRRSLGLRATTVDLGVIEDVGYISEREALAARLDRTVWTGINERLLHRILRLSILQQTAPINAASAAQLITGIPVPQKEDTFLLRDARFAGLCFGDNAGRRGGDSQDASKDAQAFFLLLKAKVDGSALLAAAVEIVNRQFMRSLGLTEPMEPAKPLSGYGLDSLAAVEFRNWARSELGAELTTLEITNAKSLSALCETIISKIVVA